ncbi:MAG TPA: MFS transporter [Mycobacteriales bacterium]|nr:MFS transporter [Mycobacteriales bacterium]
MSTSALQRRRTRAVPRVPHPNLVLAVITLGYLMVVLDTTVVNVALPRIQTGLGFSSTGLSWVLNAYMLAFGGLLLLGGRSGDILGRRRVLLGGVAVFTLASLAGGLATNSGWFLAARAVQGAGGAFIAPSGLALIATNFAEGPPRNRALSIYALVAGSGGVVGLILGGALTDLASWRWGLFINVPVGLALLVLAPRYIQEPDRRPGRLDLAGALTGTLGVASLVYGCIRASADGWTDGLTLAAFVAAAGLLTLFVAVETRAVEPIMPLWLFAHRNRAGTYLAMLLVPATMYGVFFFLTQFVQEVLGFSPLVAGLAFLPIMLPMFVIVRLVPRLLAAFGPRPLQLVGAALVLVATAWLSRLGADSGYATGLLGPMMLFGTGAGLVVMPANVVILSGVGRHEAGAASGLLQTMQWVGGSLGLAVLVTVFDTARRGAPAGSTAEAALSRGIGTAFGAAVLFVVLALLVLLLVVRPAAARRQPAEADVEAAAA